MLILVIYENDLIFITNYCITVTLITIMHIINRCQINFVLFDHRA